MCYLVGTHTYGVCFYIASVSFLRSEAQFLKIVPSFVITKSAYSLTYIGLYLMIISIIINTKIISDVFSFKSAPTPGQKSLKKFIIVGVIGVVVVALVLAAILIGIYFFTEDNLRKVNKRLQNIAIM